MKRLIALSAVLLFLVGCSDVLGLSDATVEFTVVATEPARGGVAEQPVISATFSQPPEYSTVNASSLTLEGPHGPVIGHHTIDEEVLGFRPKQPLDLAAPYRARIAQSIRGERSALPADYEWAFHSRDGTWGAPFGFSSRTYFSSTDVHDVSVSARGEVVAAFLKGPSQQEQPYFSRFADGRWSPSVPIGSRTSGAQTYAVGIATDAAGQVAATWSESSGTGKTTMISTRSAVGDWSLPHVLSTALESSYAQVALSGNGLAYAVWSVADANYDSHIVAARHGVGGWSSSTISSSAYATANARVVMDLFGNAYVIWQQSGGLQFCGYRDAWSAPVSITSVGSGDVRPRIAVNGSGRALAVWNRGDVVMAASYAAGEWTGIRTISLTGDAHDAEVSIDEAGNGLAAWVVQGGAPSVETVRFDAVTGQWDDVPRAIANRFTGRTGQVALQQDRQGNAILVWAEQDGQVTQLRASRYLAASNSWQAAVSLTSGLAASQWPVLSIGRDGTAAISYLSASITEQIFE